MCPVSLFRRTENDFAVCRDVRFPLQRSASRNGRSRVWREARRRHAGLCTPSRRRRLRRRRGLSACRESRYAARRWVIHGVYPARITPGSLRNNSRGVDAKGEAPRMQKLQISGKMSRVTLENILFFFYRFKKKTKKLLSLAERSLFTPFALLSPSLLSSSLYHRHSRITPAIF